MQDQHGRGAGAIGLLIFVRPAAIVSERFSAKELWILRWWLVREKDEHLAFDIGSLEIVPIELRSNNAMSDEYRLRIELIGRLLHLTDTHEVLQPAEGHALAARFRG